MELYDKTVLEKIGKYLLAKEETIAVAESVTSGLLQHAMSSIPDASGFYQGGITAYNIAQKYKYLHVEPIHALTTNCVSKKVAEEMSLHICKMFSSQWGISITGYASPVPESGGKVFAIYAITYLNNIKDSGIIHPSAKDPVELQFFYANETMNRLASHMPVEK